MTVPSHEIVERLQKWVVFNSLLRHGERSLPDPLVTPNGKRDDAMFNQLNGRIRRNLCTAVELGKWMFKEILASLV